MRKVWIVVANSSVSKVYYAESMNTLSEQRIFFHEEGHLTKRDLISDRQGRATQRGVYGTDTMEEQTPIKVKEATHFAERIAKFLEEKFNAGECERIYLIAKPPFLGFLRQSLHPNVAKLVTSEVLKDLTQLRPEEIREYLPPVL